jgi:hypothetical protein
MFSTADFIDSLVEQSAGTVPEFSHLFGSPSPAGGSKGRGGEGGRALVRAGAARKFFPLSFIALQAISFLSHDGGVQCD